MIKYHNILSCWHKLEFYSPAALPKSYNLQRLKDNMLPWNGNPRPSASNKTIIFTIYLGVFQSSEVNDFVKKYFKDDRKGENDRSMDICYASFKMNINGVYINESLGISTLPWALGKLEKDQINNDEWDQDFSKIQEKILSDFQQELLEVQTVESLSKIQQSIMDRSEWSIKPNVEIFIKKEEVFAKEKKKEKEEEATSEEAKSDLLNSFYIKDLETMIHRFNEKKSSKAFTDYLKGCLNLPFRKNDLTKDVSLLKETLLPEKYPDGCWPSKYRLSMMQQFAVNRVLNDLSDFNQEGLFSVNGPPGTGKTTLLRDIIAAILVKRANVMVTFTNPAEAFTKIGQVDIKDRFTPFIYKLDERLVHSGIVVASSNNGAVENISKELPLIENVAPYQHIGYFKQVTNNCVNTDYWGLISVVLGNKGNREKIVNSIWNDWDKKKLGGEDKPTLQNFLKYHKATEQEWKEVCSAFQKKQREVTDEKKRLSKSVEEYEAFEKTKQEKVLYENKLIEVKLNYEYAKEELQQRNKLQQDIKQRKSDILQELTSIKASKPGFFVYWLSKRIRNEYRKALKNAFIALNKISDELSQFEKELIKLEVNKNKSEKEYTKISEGLVAINENYNSLKKHTEAIRTELGDFYADARFWENIESKETQQSCPWYSDRLKTLQSELFVLAMQVNETFILYANATSNRISTTLHGFFAYLQGNIRVTREEMKAMWNVFFMVVPVVSTTFASIQKMFEGLAEKDLPWLFIDEAGQAIPQAAAGAIWRSQRVVVVGDPFQIEPVVTVPNIITDYFSHYFDLNNSNVHSSLSVQSMADRANLYGRYVNDTWIGSPLRVHRRCIDPMFSISNRIAYDGMMFNSTAEKATNINFKTEYLSISGAVEGRHYVPEQSAVVTELLLKEIRMSKGFPDVFVISPFTEISHKLKKELFDDLHTEVSKFGKVTKEDTQEWLKTHIGTVHTFQGKEADGVILCLGLDESSKGAATWASEKPNLLNVALTRAKYRFIAIGDKNIWLNKPFFSNLEHLKA